MKLAKLIGVSSIFLSFSFSSMVANAETLTAIAGAYSDFSFTADTSITLPMQSDANGLKVQGVESFKIGTYSMHNNVYTGNELTLSTDASSYNFIHDDHQSLNLTGTGFTDEIVITEVNIGDYAFSNLGSSSGEITSISLGLIAAETGNVTIDIEQGSEPLVAGSYTSSFEIKILDPNA